MSKKFESQHGQDQYVYKEFFKGKKSPGFFVDIGAADGIGFSNTLFFEKELGWRGICVEPHSGYYSKLVKNRRNSICVNGCIADFTGQGIYMEITGDAQMLSGLVDKYDKRHLERIENEVKENGGTVKKNKVKCYKLNEIFEKNNVEHVDYFSMDVEGSELAILKTLDFDKFSFGVFSIENNYDDPAIRSFMRSKGFYVTKNLGTDEIYVKNVSLMKKILAVFDPLTSPLKSVILKFR